MLLEPGQEDLAQFLAENQVTKRGGGGHDEYLAENQGTKRGGGGHDEYLAENQVTKRGGAGVTNTEGGGRRDQYRGGGQV